jgi:hypothetical protein
MRYAQLALDAEDYDPAAGNAVIAAIAAADAICCVQLGEHSAGDHQAARGLLARANQEAANALGRILGVKHRAHYDHIPVNRNAATTAVRAGRTLVEHADDALNA